MMVCFLVYILAGCVEKETGGNTSASELISSDQKYPKKREAKTRSNTFYASDTKHTPIVDKLEKIAHQPFAYLSTVSGDQIWIVDQLDKVHDSSFRKLKNHGHLHSYKYSL